MKTFRIPCLALCLCLFGSLPSGLADSWLPAKEFDAFSENKQFVAHITPGNRDAAKPLVVIYAVNGGNRRERWRATLSNGVAPVQAHVSDDGEFVVTLDNWFGIGYGDDVVAIYNRKGQVAKYSLEQIIPPSKPKRPDALARDDYEGRISHSTASRYWRRNSFDMFSNEPNGTSFCLWIDWDDRWVAWRLADGTLLRPAGKQAELLNTQARRIALEAIKRANDDAFAALSLLGRLRQAEDRAVVEAWLRDTEFSSAARETQTWGKGARTFYFTSSSRKRAEADRILEQWDGGGPKEPSDWTRDTYYLLGRLEFSVGLETSPTAADGIMRAYLIPASTPLDRWSESGPEHHLIANFASVLPGRFGTGEPVQPGKPSAKVNAIIFGITPGSYRLKIVWDKATPLAKPEEILVMPSTGDYESVESPVIQIRKGEITQGITVDCLKQVSGK